MNTGDENKVIDIREDKYSKKEDIQDRKDKKIEEEGKVSFLGIKFEGKIEENNTRKGKPNYGESLKTRWRGRWKRRNVDPTYPKSIQNFFSKHDKVDKELPTGAKRKIEDNEESYYIGSPSTPKYRKTWEE